MTSVIDLGFFPAKPEAKDSPEAQEMRTMLQAQAGITHGYIGKPNEVPNGIEIVNIWSSKDALAAAASEFAKVKTLVDSMTDTSDPNLKPVHTTATLKGSFEDVAAASVVHSVASFLPADVDTAAFEKAWEEAINSGPPPAGFKSGAYGWADEVIEGHPKQSPAKLWMSFMGWESLDASNAARESSEATFAPLKVFNGVVETHHTSFKKEK